MVELLNKLESYRIFNYLYPGSLFLIVCGYLGLIDLNDQNLLTTAFAAYFSGMTISRVGSLLLETALKKVGFVKFSSYKEYIQAEKNDSKISLLSEEANTFRTLATTAVTIVVVMLLKYLVTSMLLSKEVVFPIVLFAIFALYIFAYRKQVGFIKNRILNVVKKSDEI